MSDHSTQSHLTSYLQPTLAEESLAICSSFSKSAMRATAAACLEKSKEKMVQNSESNLLWVGSYVDSAILHMFCCVG